MSRAIHVAEDILPVEELGAAAARLIQRMRESGRSVVLTAAGRPAAVLIPPQEFDALREREAVRAAVEEGLADMDAGRFIEDEELEKELDHRYGAVDEP